MISRIFDLMLRQQRQKGAVTPALCDWWDARSERHEMWSLSNGTIVSIQHTSPEGMIMNMNRLYAGIIGGGSRPYKGKTS